MGTRWAEHLWREEALERKEFGGGEDGRDWA